MHALYRLSYLAILPTHPPTYTSKAAGSGVWVYAGSRTVVYRDRAEAAALDESQRALWANDRQLASSRLAC